MENYKNLYAVLLDTASKQPDADAVVDMQRNWTYKELVMNVDRAADMFWEQGIRPGDKVAIVLRNTIEFLMTNFALAKIGAVTVPINFLVTKPSEIVFILSDSHTKGVVTQNEFAGIYAGVKAKVPSLQFILSIDHTDKTGVKSFWHALTRSRYHHEAHTVHPAPKDVACLLYTSGTTGNPKGVIITHRNLISNTASCLKAFYVSHDDVFLCLLPMFHTFSWTTMAFLPIMVGCKIVMVSHITPARPWLHMMGKHGVTILAAVPQIFSVLAKEARGLKRYYLRYWAFRKTRLCASGAAPLTPSVAEHFEKALNVPLLEGYGLTEASPVVSANRVDAKKLGSVGLAIPGVKVKIVDEDNRPLGPGQEGELCVQGPNITAGYHGNKEASEEIFTPDGWLKTGDIGVIDESGYIYIRDRKKDMIIVKGLKVFSAQIETVVMEHPAVLEAAVIGVPLHDGEETIKCFCVPKPEMTIDKHELMQFLKQRLDPYKRPREIEIVEKLPKNALNKILKRTLRKQELEKRLAKLAAAPKPHHAVTH